MMRIFQFRDPTPIEALVLSADQDDATELFEEYVLRQGGDPDTLLWRELSMHHLQEEAVAAVREALELGREGLVVCEAEDRWILVVPLGIRDQAQINES
jgi:hypothetical protein